MSLDSARLKGELKTGFLAALVRYNNITDDERLAGYTMDDFFDDLANVIATKVISEFTVNGQCIGVDSHGDTHNTVGII